MVTNLLTHAGCVVFRDDQEDLHYLVISSSTNEHWVLPKGHIDSGESPEEAALRELKEETGVLGETIKSLSIQRFKKFGKKVIVQYYLIRMTDSKPPMENRQLRWEKKESALELLSFTEAKNAIRDATASLK